MQFAREIKSAFPTARQFIAGTIIVIGYVTLGAALEAFEFDSANISGPAI
jgi:hypothetical protein